MIGASDYGVAGGPGFNYGGDWVSSMSKNNDVQCKVLIVSQRQRPDGFGCQPGYIAFVEAEDVLAACSDADLTMVNHSPRQLRIRARRLGGRLVRRIADSQRPLPAILPERGKALLPREHYDLAVFVGFTIWDLPLLERMTAVRNRADRVVAWFPEAWVSEFDDERARYESFGVLDAMFVGMSTAAEELTALAPCPVHHLPPAVDVQRFAALAPNEPRPIDVLGIGRRDPRLHRALLDWSRKSNKLYVYDTISGASVADADAHRGNLGDTYRRTNVAITNFAKYDLPEVTSGDREIPGRLWEGLASGALMVGLAPDEDLQHRLVGTTVVTDIPLSPPEAVELIHELTVTDQGPTRRAQVQLALRHHDWAHRWSSVFEQSRLDSPPALQARIERLDAMAASLDELG